MELYFCRMMYENDLILRAARGENVERVPVWLMRQAGRILPEYRALRAKLSGFKELVETPHLACEVTLQPVTRLGVDAAIIFSDILVIPDAMGCTYEMVESKGPLFPNPIKSEKDIDALIIPDPDDQLGYVIEAIKLTVKELDGKIPLIGFAGAPWTILAYMIEGHGSKTFSESRKFLYTQPVLAHKLLDKITESTIAYLKAHVKAGAAMLQVFDSWAAILPQHQYTEFSVAYMDKICKAIPEVPITLFGKGANHALSELAVLDCNTIGLDWTVNPLEARALVGNSKTLQGNADPCLLYSEPKTIITQTKQMLADFGQQRYIANLGHGVYPDTPLLGVETFIETIKSHTF